MPISIDLLIHNVNCKLDLTLQLQHFVYVYSYIVHQLPVNKDIFVSSNHTFDGSCTKCVMEVDETSNDINDKYKNQVLKEELVDFCNDVPNESISEPKKAEEMKQVEYILPNNGLNHVNHNNNSTLNGDVKNVSNTEMVTNGDLVVCHNSESDESNTKKLLNSIDNNIKCEVETSDSKEDFSIKKELNGSDSYIVCKVEENQSLNEENIDKAVKDEKPVKIETISGQNNVEKDKFKSKEYTGSNSYNCHSSSSSSNGKKHDEQNSSYHSSSSSSSSRSRNKENKDYSHRSSSSCKSGHDKSGSHKLSEQDKSKHDSLERKRSHSCHHRSDEKCRCKSHHHSRHSSKSRKFQSVKTQCTADEIAFELRNNKVEISNPYFTRVPWCPHPQLTNLKYGRFYRIEVDRNGGASIVHLYMDEISHLNEAQMKECAVEFIKLSYSEDENECAYHVMGIVHGAAAYLPDLVDYMADHYPTLTVKTGSLASRDNHTTTMSQYRDEVYKTYSNGTFRYAPLDQLSICGVLGEEVGAYFPDFVARLEQSPFMKPVMPWSSLSVVQTDNPRESNDGPIFWVRPGEQMLPANEALKESARPKKRRNNELDNLAYIAGARSSEARESLFMDRTKAHADQVGVDYGLSNTAPTAAVGVLKSVNCGHPEHGNRATKDVVAFHAQDYNELLEILMLDLYEPPQTQCTKWIEVSKLNTLRREGIRYAHVQLHDNDVYYLPRKIIHQFQTISSVASVAWHIRYRDYFSILGAPNLHTPTGINKGQVFYEKKNVAVYYPPICENDLLASVTNPGSPGSKAPKKYDKLKEYSPCKPSPRKNHKMYSPRTNSKKEKNSDHRHHHTPSKKDTESMADDEEEKKRKKSEDQQQNGRETSDSSSRKDRDSSKKSENYNHHHHHHQSSDHSAKKDRSSQESRSNHRKEVKNLESEFDGKKSQKSKTEKNRGHEEGKRRSDESSSRHKKHDDGSKSKSHSKHEKHGSHKKSPVVNGSAAEGEERAGKRKRSDSQESSSAKRIKEKHSDDRTEVSVKTEIVMNPEESQIVSCNSGSGCESADAIRNAIENDVKSEPNDNGVTDCVHRQENAMIDDLEESCPAGENMNFVLSPPLPSTSPPSNPPLPPNSPSRDLSVNQHPPPPPPPPPPPDEPMAEETSAGNKDKINEPVKKPKKKPVKKIAKEETESYDLLGDIMSQMDKKK